MSISLQREIGKEMKGNGKANAYVRQMQRKRKSNPERSETETQNKLIGKRKYN